MKPESSVPLFNVGNRDIQLRAEPTHIFCTAAKRLIAPFCRTHLRIKACFISTKSTIMKLLIVKFFPVSCYFHTGTDILVSTLFSEHFIFCDLPEFGKQWR